jgi:diguanylate cyclase (GGDEF)-like protein/PAS domain S-box-containing protein
MSTAHPSQLNSKIAPRGNFLVRGAVVVLAYFLTGKLGLELASIGSLVTLIWMPSGIAVAALYRLGRRYWPAIWMGAFAINLVSGSGLAAAFGIALGNTLAPLLAVTLLRYLQFNPAIAGARDVAIFAGFGALLSMAISALIGSLTLVASSVIEPHALAWAAFTWWLGDSVGMLLCGMALITYERAELLRLCTGPKQQSFFSAIALMFLIGAAWMLSPASPVTQILLCTFPVAFAMWVAISLGTWAAASAILCMAILGVSAASLGRGPFADASLYLAITKFWAYMGTVSLVSLLVSALNLERTAAHQQLVQAEARFRALTHLSSDWFWEQDTEFRFTHLEGDLRSITGWPNEDHLGKTRWEVPYWDMPDAVWDEHRAVLARHETFRDFELSRKSADGQVIYYSVSGAPFYDESGRFAGYRGVGSNISKRRVAEDAVKRIAHFDALTELPNRVLFSDRLQTEFRRSQRSGRKIALLMLDLDHFKEVNDTLGHDQGDSLLVMVAKRLKACVRAADTVARMGGDEFMVILCDLDTLRPVELIAQNILQSLSQPYDLSGGAGKVTASIGIALYPDDAVDVESLLKKADQAMYAAKTAGRNRFSFYTQEVQDSAERRIWLAQDIRRALQNHQFWIAYQPIVNLADGSINKAEALIRWQHPERGMIEPAVFLPVAESSGLIGEIGEWVFSEVAAQAKRWRLNHHSDFQISINKSPVQFYRPGGAAISWHQQLHDIGVGGRSIVVEIAESLLLDSSASVGEQIRALHGEGMQISIDDFGAGAYALTDLQKHDIDFVKIDQAFVQALDGDSKELALSQAIIAMAHKLGIQVIAQGIESETQRSLLKAAGCDYGQGYLFAHPMPAEEFDVFLSRHQLQQKE